MIPHCGYTSSWTGSECTNAATSALLSTTAPAGNLRLKRQVTAGSSVSGATTASASFNPACTAASAPAPSFTLTVISQVPCNKPVADLCNSTSNPGYSPSQWSAYSVDDFWHAWVQNNSAAATSGNFISNFFCDFSGCDASATLNSGYACQADDEVKCTALQSCSNVKTTTPYASQAYLVWAALINLSEVINTVWLALDLAQGDLNTMMVGFGKTFSDIPPQATSWEHIFNVVSSILTLIAVVFIFAEVALAVGTLIGLSTLFGGASNIGTLSAAEITTSFELAQIATDNAIFKSFTDSLRSSLVTIHDDWFLQGTNMSTLLDGGAYLGSGQVIQNQNTPDPDQSGAVLGAAHYFENMVIQNLINDYFKASDVYIVYVSK